MWFIELVVLKEQKNSLFFNKSIDRLHWYKTDKSPLVAPVYLSILKGKQIQVSWFVGRSNWIYESVDTKVCFLKEGNITNCFKDPNNLNKTYFNIEAILF